MKEIIILNKDTYRHLMDTLKQCYDWLATDASYSHRQSNIRIVNTNVLSSLRMINNDIEEYKDNVKILVEELNKKAGV